VALLGSHALHPLLLADRWNGSEGPLFEVRFGLRVDAASQRLVYDGSRMQGQTARLVEAPDQHSVIATQAALAGQRGVPAAWQVVAQFTDVAQAAGNAIAATVLLHSGAAAQQEDLLRLVFQLRSQHGRTLKIVVLETQDKLRSNLEQALLNLGANTVVYREVGFARLQRLLDGMCDETYAREIPADYAAARAGFMPDAVRGYLPGTAFCDSVEAMLVRSSSFGLQHCFLRLSMQPHVAHLDAIQACVALRDGDVLSADHNALYVFMFACAEADIEPALARLFSIPPGELFAARTLYTSVDGMRATLRDLREAARNGVPDYSGYRIAPTNPQARGSTGRAPAAQYATLPQPALVQTPPDTGQQSVPPPAPTVYARPLGRRLPAQTQGDPHAA
jgi:cellulose biosynthesis protein BcsE